ncbi:hypothetical protein BGZ93_007857 [Podila epicladia]|nr:hypothetical protein BGZ92_005026 [Podila epicladia]KAG0093475.1 hypothetical protein BGZ93_007857 [Podila epicladia]
MSGVLLLDGDKSDLLSDHIPETVLGRLDITFQKRHWATVDIKDDQEQMQACINDVCGCKDLQDLRDLSDSINKDPCRPSSNTTTQAGVHQKQLTDHKKNGKRPDMLLSYVTDSTQLVCELGYGEFKVCGKGNFDALNARDLVKVGIMLKDLLDMVEDKYSVSNSVHIGFQGIGDKVDFFLMAKVRSIIVMKLVCSMDVPDSIDGLRKLAHDYRKWRLLECLCEKGYKDWVDALKSCESVSRKSHARTMSSQELRSIKDNY